MTTRPISSDELLELARAFVPEKAAPGRPRSAHLRRGVSLAYYALFHELVDQGTVQLCGPAPTQATRRQQAARWFAHTDLRRLAEATTGAGGGAGRAVAEVLGPLHPDLVEVADAFRKLQDARYRADYDHEFEITRGDAALLLESAADAIERVRRLRRDGEASLQLFLRLMVGAVKIARTRAV